jgi:hypothetical protein
LMRGANDCGVSLLVKVSVHADEPAPVKKLHGSRL